MSLWEKDVKMLSVNHGSTLRTNDLYIRFYNTVGQVVAPFSVVYDILYLGGTSEELVISDRTPELNGGAYWASFTVGGTTSPVGASFLFGNGGSWPYGTYRIQWKANIISGAPTQTVIEDFDVLALVAKKQSVSVEVSSLNNMRPYLRHMLRDNDPDRNYHFRPPESASSLYPVTEFSYIWEDMELNAYIQLAVGLVNLSPPRTRYGIHNMNDGWSTITLLGAAWLALQAVSINWAAESFNYSMGSISLDLSSKFSNYSSLADSYKNSFESALGRAKETVLFTKGLVFNYYYMPIRHGASFWRTWWRRFW